MGFFVVGGMIFDLDGGWEELENWSRLLELLFLRIVNWEVEVDRLILVLLILVEFDDFVSVEVNLMLKVFWVFGILLLLIVIVNIYKIK